MMFHGLTLSRIATVGLMLALCGPLGVGLAALSGIGHRWVDIVAQFTAAAILAAILLTAAAVALRLWPAVAAGAATCLILLIAGWPQWLPPTGRPVPDAPVITLYSANLFRLNDDVPAIKASIQEAQADIVVLIETPHELARFRIDDLLPDHPNRFREIEYQHGMDGTVIASRWPVRYLKPHSGSNARAAVVETPLGDVTVVAVHLTRPWPYQVQWEQIRQAESLERSMQGITGPVILVGDFNSVSSARIGRMIRRDLGVIPAPGWPGTWPASAPSIAAITIDQVYRTPDLAFVGRRLGRRSGSDHRPVVTRITRAEPQPRP